MKHICGWVLAAGLGFAQQSVVEQLELKGLNAEAVEYKGRRAVKLTEAPPPQPVAGLAIRKGETFKDGAIEVWVAGEPGAGAGAAARGFVGIAFRVRGTGEKYEAFYLRPTNGRAGDQVRRNHSLQYISEPEHPWHRLRKEFPEKYESYADLQPGEWTKVRIEAEGRKARLFVNGASQPSLIVNDLLLGEEGGGIAYWVGPGTVAHFAEFTRK